MPWRRLAPFALVVAALHLAGVALLAVYLPGRPVLLGLGMLAYTFGLRHAFDADHIAAIDATTRKLLQDGRRPLGVGFFFSLGHSTVVFAVAAAVALASSRVKGSVPTLRHLGGAIGTGVSGTFLLAVGLLNLVVLLDVVSIFRAMRRGGGDPARLEARLLDRGLMSRGPLRRLGGWIDASWRMYPLGFLFGLGFDTASEVALLALSAGAAGESLPAPAVLALPLLFSAGMSLLDTADGAFMSHAYGWAFTSPVRKAYYNITVTALSVAVSLAVGGVELLQLALRTVWLDLSTLGYLVVALSVAAWAISAAIWKARRIEDRWAPATARAEVSLR